MSRHSQRKTQRVRVQSQGSDPRFVTAAKIDGRAAGRAGAEAAFGLADMLNNLMPLAEKAEKDTARQAEADFQTGNVDPNNTSRIYRNNVNRLSARANWIKDEADINESLKGLDLDNISQPELDAHIDEQFRKKYDGLDDPTIAQELLPKLQTYREEKYAEVLSRKANRSTTSVSTTRYVPLNREQNPMRSTLTSSRTLLFVMVIRILSEIFQRSGKMVPPPSHQSLIITRRRSKRMHKPSRKACSTMLLSKL
jgi:hypothetical protein